MLFVWIILGIVLLVIILLWATYNSLVRLKIKTDEALSDITVQMKRRFDLIPNLINTVKGYAKHEKDTLENVTKARTAAMSVAKDDLNGQAKADNMLTSTLKSLFAVAENYPDLKANTNFLQLQDELAGTENRIAVARMDYNGAVQGFNAKIKSFPTVLYAGMFGFDARDYFKADESAKTVPQVQF